MVRIICEHAERIQYVRNYKVRLAINRNTKPIYILPDEVVNDKKIPAAKVRRDRSFRCAGTLSAASSP